MRIGPQSGGTVRRCGRRPAARRGEPGAQLARTGSPKRRPRSMPPKTLWWPRPASDELPAELADPRGRLQIRVQPGGRPSGSGLDHAPSTASSIERAASAWRRSQDQVGARFLDIALEERRGVEEEHQRSRSCSRTSRLDPPDGARTGLGGRGAVRTRAATMAPVAISSSRLPARSAALTGPISAAGTPSTVMISRSPARARRTARLAWFLSSRRAIRSMVARLQYLDDNLVRTFRDPR